MRLKDEEKVKIYTFLCYLFWIFNLLPKKLLPSLAAEFILIFWIFSGDWLKKKQALKENIHLYLYICLFFLVELFSLVYSTDLKTGLHELQKNILLFCFPPILFSITYLSLDWQKIAKNLAILTIIFAFFNLFYAGYRHFFLDASPFVFFGEDLLSFSGKHNAYYALYLNTAILILLPEITKQTHEIKTKIGYILCILFAFIFIILLGNRMAFLSCLLLFGLYIVRSIFPKIGHNWKVTISLIALVFLGTLPIFFPTFVQRLRYSFQTQIDWENRNPLNNHFGGNVSEKNWEGSSFRLAKWISSWDQIEKAPLLGYGIGDRHATLLEGYRARKFWMALDGNFTSHNQYLTILLSVGLLGLVLFLLQCYMLAQKSIRLKNKEYIYFIGFILLAMLTEDMLLRQQGVFFIAFFYPLLLWKNKLYL